jgi:hypothetical protein
MARCFAIMPFSQAFNPVIAAIRRAVRQVASEREFRCERADDSLRPGFVLSAIRERIEGAEVVIADLTHKNPNVFYELGAAHILRGPAKVVLISQRTEDIPFDVQPFRHIFYDRDRGGLSKLQEELTAAIGEALGMGAGRLVETVMGRGERGRRIAEDLDLLAQQPKQKPCPIIRQVSSLSVFALNRKELKESFKGQDDLIRNILEEKRATLELLRQRKAVFKGIIAPRRRRMKKDVELLRLRFKELERLMSSNDLPPSQVQMAILEPGASGSTWILGERVIYDGIKADPNGSYDLTLRLTDRTQLKARVRTFDALFDAAVKATWPEAPEGELSPKGLRAAFLKKLAETWNTLTGTDR